MKFSFSEMLSNDQNYNWYHNVVFLLLTLSFSQDKHMKKECLIMGHKELEELIFAAFCDANTNI